jgi:hypothetical protein
MAVPIPYVHAWLGLICTIGSMPLILGIVPMNRLVGIRIEKALVSAHNWYALNAFGGKWLLGFGVFLLGFCFLTQGLAPPPRSLWAPIYLTLPLLGIAPMMISIKRYASRLPD